MPDKPLRYASLGELLQAMRDLKPNERLSEVLARRGLKSPVFPANPLKKTH